MDKDLIQKKLKALGIGRFQVMALLQAARHYVLTNDLRTAKSFGLNRAIFYAWAKYYGPHRKPYRLLRIAEMVRKQRRGERMERCPDGFREVLGECVEVSPRGYYMIGGKEQTDYDFEHQIMRKVKILVGPDRAWEAAVEYVSSFPRDILMHPGKFYKFVYEPVRDTFFEELISRGRVEPPREYIDILGSEGKRVRKDKSLYDFIGSVKKKRDERPNG